MKEAEQKVKMGQRVWLPKVSPVGRGRGTGQPGGGSHSSTLTQSSHFNGPLAQGSLQKLELDDAQIHPVT